MHHPGLHLRDLRFADMGRILLALALLLVVLAGCGDSHLRAASRSGSVVWAVGDGGNGSDEARHVADLIGADRPRRVLYLGDVYETGTAADFRERFATVYGRLVRRMDPTPGNHDWPHHAGGYDPYWRKVKGRRLPHHYAFSVAGWRIVSVNSQTPRDAKQLAFLRRTLAGVKRGCAIVFMHRPRFNAGEHRDEQRDVDPLWRALRGKAAILLSGHDHNLQRFRPVGGTTQYVVGAGGRGRYNVNERDPRLAFSRDTTDGALRLLLKPGLARMSIVAADGRVIDGSTARC
jgi:hypothetical protein